MSGICCLHRCSRILALRCPFCENTKKATKNPTARPTKGTRCATVPPKPPLKAHMYIVTHTANSVNLTRDLGSILRPSQDKILLGIRRSRKRLGLNRLVGNFDGNHPFSCTNDFESSRSKHKGGPLLREQCAAAYPTRKVLLVVK